MVEVWRLGGGQAVIKKEDREMSSVAFGRELCLGWGPEESTLSPSRLKKKMQTRTKHSSRKPHCSTSK